jgi:hypothetical protein
MAASSFVEVSDKGISEIKMNSDQKNTKKTCAKILRLGDYRGIFTSTSSRRMFPDNHLAFGEQLLISIYSGDGYSAVRAI